MIDLAVKSSAFENHTLIPGKYTCDGEEVNPPLTIYGIPAEAKTLVLIVDDPDAGGGTFDHWLVWNISTTGKIDENSTPGTQGINSDGQRGYVGMCPPSGTHRYFFKVFALDVALDLKPASTRKHDLERAMQGHILARGELIGLYNRI